MVEEAEAQTKVLSRANCNTGQGRKFRVLVIDDEPRIVHLLNVRLKLSGYEVITAGNGEHGLELARTETPDVILLDLLMPGKDGFEVLKELRTFSRVPVIVVSAREDTLASRVVKALGADDALGKPFNWEQLLSRIERMRWRC